MTDIEWTGATDCPYCNAYANFNDRFNELVKPRLLEAPFPKNTYRLVQCTRCNGLMLLVLQEQHEGNEIRHLVVDTFPAQRAAAPDGTPADVGQDFCDALEAFNKGLWKPSVMSARAALQGAMRERGAKGSNLREEIDDLADRGAITSDMKDWAHEVRLSGNIANHPKPGQVVTREEAEEILDFAEDLFTYMYTLPKKVADRRAKFAPPESP